jgi:hypothetical protein
VGGYDEGMKRLYCWKCGTIVPMLDDDEWAQIEADAKARDDKRGRIRLLMSGYKALTGQTTTDKHAFE